jgi:hypothetical protein
MIGACWRGHYEKTKREQKGVGKGDIARCASDLKIDSGRNVSHTARRLKMHRRTLQRILNKRAPK